MHDTIGETQGQPSPPYRPIIWALFFVFVVPYIFDVLLISYCRTNRSCATIMIDGHTHNVGTHDDPLRAELVSDIK